MRYTSHRAAKVNSLIIVWKGRDCGKASNGGFASAALILRQVQEGVPVVLACPQGTPAFLLDTLKAVIERLILYRWHHDLQAYSPFLKA